MTVDDRENFPHMVCARPPHLTLPTPLAPFLASTSPGAPPAPQQSVKTCFIRGSVIKYVQLPASEVDTELLQDAAMKENATK